MINEKTEKNQKTKAKKPIKQPVKRPLWRNDSYFEWGVDLHDEGAFAD